MRQPQGLILRLVKEPMIHTEWLCVDDGLAVQEWTSERKLALTFETYQQADNRADQLRATIGSVYAAVIVRPTLPLDIQLHDQDFLPRHGGRHVLNEEIRRRRTLRRQRNDQRAESMRAYDLAELDRVATGRNSGSFFWYRAARFCRALFFANSRLRCYYVQVEIPGRYLNSPRQWQTVFRVNAWNRAEADRLAIRVFEVWPQVHRRIVPREPVQEVSR